MAGMRRPPRLLLHLLGLLLLLQSGAAAASCLRSAAHPGIAVEICSAEGGMRTVLLPGDPAEDDASPQPGFCAACHALPAIDPPPPPALTTPIPAPIPGEAWALRPGFLPPAGWPPGQPARGPPALV